MEKQFEDINCSRGAPMGRPYSHGDIDARYNVELFRVRLSEGYDDGGAYWGQPITGTVDPLWCARGDSICGEFHLELFFRAPSKENAAAQLTANYPRAHILDTTETEIKPGMALAFFASAYAEQADECEQPLRGEIMDQLPDAIDPAAIHAADTLTADLCRMHRATLADLYAANCGELSPENWGHYAAMGAMGHGVGLWDHNIELEVGYCEFGSHSLEKDYFEPVTGGEEE